MMQRLLILIIVILTMVMCVKRTPVPNTLPEATQIGGNTVGCKINGEIYIPELRRFVLMSVPVSLSYPTFPDFSFWLRTTRIAEESEMYKDASVNFNVRGVDSIGKYNLRFGKVKYRNEEYELDSTLLKGELNVTRFDTIKGIISGTFNFNAICLTNKTKKVTITDGRFDLKNNTK